MIGKRIRAVREYLGIARPEFAEQTGIKLSSLKNWELGYREKIPAQVIAQLAEVEQVQPFITYIMLGEGAELIGQAEPVHQ